MKKNLKMLTVEQISKLRRFFRCTGELEMKQEDFRYSLCSLPNFNPLYVMKLLDKEDKGYITKYDLQRFWGIHNKSNNSHRENIINLGKSQKISIESKIEEIEVESFDIMVRYFDLDNDGCLNYDEMMFILLLCTDNLVIKQIK